MRNRHGEVARPHCLLALGVLNMAPLALLLSGPLGRIGWVVPQYWAAVGFLSGISGSPSGLPETANLGFFFRLLFFRSRV